MAEKNTEEELAELIEWLQNAKESELRKAIRETEKEIFRT